MNQGPVCLRCRSALPPNTGFCASCGFDNGALQREEAQASFDERIETRLAWLRLQMFLRWLFWRSKY